MSLPQDFCPKLYMRKAISDGGEDPLVVCEETFLPLTRRRKPTRKDKFSALDIVIPTILCPIQDCGKDLKDIRGLSSHLLAHHRQSIDDFILDPEGSGIYVPKPAGWIPYLEPMEPLPANSHTHEHSSSSIAVIEEPSAPTSSNTSSSSSSSHPFKPSESAQIEAGDASNDSIPREESGGDFGLSIGRDGALQPLGYVEKIDKRRFNKGQAKRKSYDKHLKLQCIAMRDDGKSTEEIMRTLGIAKGHIEKWYSPKNRERTLERATIAFQTSSKTIQAIKDAAEAASSHAQSRVNGVGNGGYGAAMGGGGGGGGVGGAAWGGGGGGRGDASLPVEGSRSTAQPFVPSPLPGMNVMSMVGALSNYTASLSSNTTLLRDGQTLSTAVPSGLSVSAGTILGLHKKLRKREKKRKVLDTAAANMMLMAKKTKRPGSAPQGSLLGAQKKGRPNPRAGTNDNDSDSDDEDGVMELLGESRTRKPSSSSSAGSSASDPQ